MSVQLLSSAPRADFHARTQAWQSVAAGAPTLRGHHSAGSETIHFLSGNGFCGGVYWPFLRGLLPDYGLFTHDIEGHGASDAPLRFSGINAVCQRVITVIAEQKLKAPLIGMGHSFGAALTLKLAAENPGLFRALVLLDPIAMPPMAWRIWRSLALIGQNPIAKSTRKRRDHWASRDEVVERLRDRGIYKGWTDEALDCFADYATRDEEGARVLCCPKELEAQIFNRTLYTWDYFPKVNVPILYLHGASSYGFFPASARLAQKLNPGVAVRTLPGGHCFMQEDPSAAAAVVRSFLKTPALG